ncbi:MAG: DUF4270 family protein [Saprospiraceae bacterium]|nr:MAG: DUF4270 family protein [Saprospiraceae bacterium]
MKKIHSIALWVAGSLLVALFACNDPTVIGSDLLAGDQPDLEFTDTITVKAYTITGDSVRTFAPLFIGTSIQSFLCGNFQDPIFGRSVANIYAQVSLNLNASLPDFKDAELDSMVFILPWQSDNFYGRTNETFYLGLFELDESMSRDSIYYSNQSFKVKPGSIGHIQFTPNPADSVTLAVPGKDSVFVKVEPQLRVPLDASFSDGFLTAGETNFSSDSSFLAFFKGIRISPALQNAGMLSFNLRSSIAGIRVYYHKDTVYNNYFFPILTSNVVTTHMENDHTGSIAGAFADAPSANGDSLLFLQGMEGLSLVVEIPWVEDFEKVIINRAELEFSTVKLMEDFEDFDPVTQVVVSEIADDSTIKIIDDVQFAINRARSNFSQIFGGDFDSADNTYKLNITSHFQGMMSGSKSKKLMVTVYNRAEHPSRVVLAGPQHSAHPVKLNVSFTRF